jgi:two-component system OmpR family response regulator
MTTPVRVLLTDDEPQFLDSLGRVLRRRGLDVRTAGDGLSALTMVAASTPDVIVLDLKMPGIDGVETLRRLRAQGCASPVLLLTAWADVELAAAALKEGATDYLVKPCPVEELVAAIEDASERAAAALGVNGP